MLLKIDLNPITAPHMTRSLFPLLLLKSLWALALILWAGIHLVPDEAQYWTWSRSLDWAYYSKPPGIAWQIFLSTSLLGHTELGIRFSAVVMNLLLCGAVYRLSLTSGCSHLAALTAAACMGLSPMGLLGSFLATTDGGFVLFWTLAMIPLAQAIQTEREPNYRQLGILLALGALWKWPIYILWIPVALLACLKAQWRSRSLIHGILLSLLALLPSLIWNFQHDWATFKHVWAQMTGGPQSHGLHAPPANPLDFIGAQVALLSPMLFILLICAFTRLRNHTERLPQAVKFLSLLSLITLSIYVLLACIQKMQGNWAVFTYPGFCVLLGWAAVDARSISQRSMKWSLLTSLVLCSLVALIPLWQTSSLPAPAYALNPFRHSMGWDRLGPELEAVGYEPNQDFLAGHQYQMASLLSFYGPGQQRAHLLNIRGSRRNQFSYWEGLQVSSNGFLVLSGQGAKFHEGLEGRLQRYKESIAPYFTEVHLITTVPLFKHKSEEVKTAAIYRCEGYLGQRPPDPEAY